jgi:predicted dehydrogenase
LTTAAKQTIRVAIAGAGMVTRHHLLAWRKISQVEIVAICARHLKNAAARASEFNIPGTYDDVAAMLEREKPDVIDIATPPDVHADQVRMAAARGIHILCQKPMTNDPATAEKLVAEVGDRVRFMVHENWRFRPPYRQAARWLAAGKAGRVCEFQLTARSSGLVTRTESGRPFALERQPFFTRLKRFIIMELLIHHLDTIRYLVGPLKVVAASADRISPEVMGEDVALISLKAASGAFGTVAGNFSAAGFPPLPQDRLELIGEKASILFEGDVLRIIGETEKTIRFDREESYQHSYDNAIAHFVKALESGEPFETDRWDNLKTLQLVADAYRLAGM